MNISHLSVSRKQCWDLCQQQYKYRYHLNVVSNKPQPIYFAYGQIIHKGAELFVESKGNNTLEYYIKNIIEGNIPYNDKQENKNEKISLPREYQNKLSGHVRAVKKITEMLGFEGELEFKFDHDLDPPNNVKILGFIDRLIKRKILILFLITKQLKKACIGKINLQLKAICKCRHML